MDAVAAVRSFNRFYTRLVGALDAHFLGTDLSLAEARLLFEIAQRKEMLAAELQAALDMDPGFVSRVLRRFEMRGWIARQRSAQDARRRPIRLTDAGHVAFAKIERRQRAQVAALVDGVERPERLVAALGTVQALLTDKAAPGFTIRTFQPGDMGAIAGRQAKLFAEGWGWARPMEVLLGEVTTAFLRDFKPGREQCWVAESGGRMAGSIFLVEGENNVARLRLLYVEPWAQGQGIGHALVERCVSAAREAGYDAVELWTNAVLLSARRIYAAAGFRILREEVHDTFGRPEQGEIWRLDLNPRGAVKEPSREQVP